MKLTLATVVTAALALSSCASDVRSVGVAGSMFEPTSTVAVVISPQLLPIVPVSTFGCPLFSPFTTDFGLFVSAGGSRSSVESVTLRLVDGSNVGGPTVTFPQPDLVRMFGSTLVVDSRTFLFQPRFGCGAVRPRALIADVTVIGTGGAIRTLTTSASFR